MNPPQLTRSTSVYPSFLSNPIEYAMAQLSKQVNSVIELEKRVKETGVREPCPVKGGKILDFEAYLTWYSHPDLYEPEEEEEGESVDDLVCWTCPGCGGCTREHCK